MTARRGLWEVCYHPYDVTKVFVRTPDGLGHGAVDAPGGYGIRPVGTHSTNRPKAEASTGTRRLTLTTSSAARTDSRADVNSAHQQMIVQGNPTVVRESTIHMSGDDARALLG